MKALLADEQELLRDTVARIATGVDGPVPEPGSDLSTEAWSTLADAGFCSVATPGREGLGSVEVALVCEALGGRLSPLPYIGSCLAPTALVASVASDHELFDDLAVGHRLAVALDPTLSDLALATPALAVDCAGASRALMVVDESLVAAPLGSRVRTTADLTRVVRDVSDGEPEAIAAGGALDGSWRLLVETALCADMVGVMQRSLDLAVEWAKDRVQFGRPIGSFQAVQHLCAEQAIRLEAARSATYYAAWAVDAAPGEAPAAVATARAFVAPAARSVAETTIQVLGGIGITWESEAHLHLRRVIFDAAVLGSRTVGVAPRLSGGQAGSSG